MELPDDAHIGRVSLTVRDLDRSVCSIVMCLASPRLAARRRVRLHNHHARP